MPKPDPEAFRKHMERVHKERTEAVVNQIRDNVERANGGIKQVTYAAQDLSVRFDDMKITMEETAKAINQAILNDFTYRKRSP